MTKIFLSLLDETKENPPCVCEKDECLKIGRQYADVSLPVELKPKTTIGKIEVKCCGEPTVDCEDDICSDVRKIVITQKICVSIPIQYELTARTSDCSIECCCGE